MLRISGSRLTYNNVQVCSTYLTRNQNVYGLLENNDYIRKDNIVEAERLSQMYSLHCAFVPAHEVRGGVVD